MSIIGIIHDSDPAENVRPNTKQLFSYPKNCRQDSHGTAPLKENGKTCTDNVKKANLLNTQFQSVFTPKSIYLSSYIKAIIYDHFLR